MVGHRAKPAAIRGVIDIRRRGIEGHCGAFKCGFGGVIARGGGIALE